MAGQNKYKTARIASGLSQETAAEKLYTSVSNLKRIERGTQRCNADIAGAMAELYGTPWVADPTIPEDYAPLPLAQATLRYINEREDVERLIPRARRILADGVISRDEENDFAEFSREILEEQRAARDLLYAG